MNCQKCGKELDDETAEISATFADHNKNMIDVIVTCIECEGNYNGFLALNEMVFYE